MTNSVEPTAECDREPIHIPGSIQPHGVLLALNPANLTVVQLAGDTLSLLGVRPEELSGASLHAHLGVAAFARLKLLQSQPLAAPRPFFLLQIDVRGEALDVFAHLSGGLIVLEFTRRTASDPVEPIELVQSMAAAIRGAPSAGVLLDAVVREVQRVCGFDRVMVYRFDEAGSGRVEAEQRSGDTIDSYLGLAYPASDIPRQARQLYLKNWIRCIPDVRYLALPIVPQLNPVTGLPLDLTHSTLRSVSPIHLQYLSNMGVSASMSLSIVVDGRLWGLIACHHYAPRFLDTGLQCALELFAQLASMQLTTTLAFERARQDAFRRDIHGELLAALADGGFPMGLSRNAALLMELVSATGVAIHAQGTTSCHGSVPVPLTLEKIIALLNSQSSRGVWATDRLSEHDQELTGAQGEVAGVLALSISRQPRDHVIWFLPELRTTVRWAGNPHKAASMETGKLEPRTSFAAWNEEVAGRSRPWQEDEIAAAERLRTAILETTLVHLDELTRDREATARRQDLLMRELDHRVKNILQTIQSVVRFSGKSTTSLDAFTKGLEQRLVSMAKAHDLLTSARWAGATLHRLIEDELSAFSSGADGRYIVSGDDALLVPSAALALSLVLHELATNAAKYGALSVPEGLVVVTCERASDGSGAELIDVQWIERGGPRVTAPAQKGFGCLLLEKIYQEQAGMSVSLSFEPDGVRCSINLRADRTLARQGSPVTGPPKSSERTSREVPSLNGVNVLLVEDDPIVAMDIAEIIAAAGGRMAGSYHGLDESLAAAAGAEFDVALLDVDLGGVPVWPLAQAIKLRGVPIVFATGFSDVGLWPAEFKTSVTVHKPYDRRRLLQKLHSAVAGNA